MWAIEVDGQIVKENLEEDEAEELLLEGVYPDTAQVCWVDTGEL